MIDRIVHYGSTSCEAFREARILIVDDQVQNVELLDRLLRKAGFSSIVGLTDPAQTGPTMQTFQPDLVCLDLVMPGMDGFAVLESMAPDLSASPYLPVLVLSADITAEAKRRALASGAKDFIAKPFDAMEVLLRIRNLLETRFVYQRLERHNDLLEELVRERTAELSRTQERIAEELNETVVRGIFAASLAVQAVGQVTDEPKVLERVESAVKEMDSAIRHVRTAVFDLRQHRPSGRDGGV